MEGLEGLQRWEGLQRGKCKPELFFCLFHASVEHMESSRKFANSLYRLVYFKNVGAAFLTVCLGRGSGHTVLTPTIGTYDMNPQIIGGPWQGHDDRLTTRGSLGFKSLAVSLSYRPTPSDT